MQPIPLIPRSPPSAATQVGMFDDRVGPTIIACMVLVTLLAVFTLALYDFLF